MKNIKYIDVKKFFFVTESVMLLKIETVSLQQIFKTSCMIFFFIELGTSGADEMLGISLNFLIFNV